MITALFTLIGLVCGAAAGLLGVRVGARVSQTMLAPQIVPQRAQDTTETPAQGSLFDWDGDLAAHKAHLMEEFNGQGEADIERTQA